MNSFREVFANFTVTFNGRELQKGNREVDNAKRSMARGATSAGSYAGVLRGVNAASLLAAAGQAALAIGVGAVSARLLGAAQAGAELGEKLKLDSSRLGVTTREMQALGLMAEAAGKEAEEAVDAVGTLQERARDAVLDPKSDPAVQLRQLGIEIPRSVDELPDGMSLYAEVADAFAGLSNQTDKVGAAMTLFGDVGRHLLPVIEQGAAGVEDYKNKVEELGGGFSDEALDASAEFMDMQRQMGIALDSVKSRILTLVLPSLTALQHGLTGLSVWWLKNERGIKAIGAAFVVSAGVAVATYWSTIFPALLSAAAAFLSIALPVAAVTAAFVGLVLVIEDFFAFLQGNRSVIGDLLQSLFDLNDTTLDGIRAEFGEFFRMVERGYNAIAGVIGLPELEQNTINDAIGLDVSNARTNQKMVSGSPLDPRLTGAAGAFDPRNPATAAQFNVRSFSTPSPSPVTQTNTINVTGDNPREIAAQVERVLDRQNRDAFEVNQ